MSVHSYTAKLSYSTDGGTTYTDVDCLLKITPNPLEMAKSKATKLNSSGATHEYKRGWKEPGEITFSTQYDSTVYKALYDLYNKLPNAAPEKWRITFPLDDGETTAATWVQDGFITGETPTEASVDSDDQLMNDWTLSLTGTGTFTEAA